MTLVVYKDGVLAADSRASLLNKRSKPHTCGHCGNKENLVLDNSNKITLFNGDQPIIFKEQKIIAVAEAGATRRTGTLIALLKAGEDIEVAYNHYLAFHDATDLADSGSSSTLLIVCEHNFFTVKAIRKEKLAIEKHPLDKYQAIGSGADAANWLHALNPDLPGTVMINLVMARDESVGGMIQFVDIVNSPKELMTFMKQEPAELLGKVATAFASATKELVESQVKI
jgi:hypothetical protein